mgnify:CR=1 FL=1
MVLHAGRHTVEGARPGGACGESTPAWNGAAPALARATRLGFGAKGLLTIIVGVLAMTGWVIYRASRQAILHDSEHDISLLQRALGQARRAPATSL